VARSDLDNRSNQLNPNNDAYHQSRGYEGRDDYCADDDSSGWRSWRNYSGPVWDPPRTPDEIAGDEVMRKVVRGMTPEKAGNSICDYLRYLFEDMLFVSTSEGSEVIIMALNCAPGSPECAELAHAIRCWLAKQSWTVAGCVTSVSLVLQDCSRMNFYDK
jgi:hypothetical protein